MSVGELTVSIIGDISKLSRSFSQASSEVGKFGSSVATVGSSMTSKVGGALTTVATAAAVTGTALGVGLVGAGAKSLSMFNDFEKSVSNAASVTGLAGDAFAKAKENISAVAQELGQKTAFSSSQAADALYNLASAGVDVSQITSSQLVPVLNLASGTQYDLAATTSAVTSTLSQFGLGFESAGRVADVFAKDAGLTQASMDKLSVSMNYVGTIANTCGISLETTSASLGVLYNAGMDGSTAGTSLRGVLASLVSPTDKAAGVLKGMGLTIADVNPTTNSFTDIVQKLADKGLNATQAFEIFGRESAPAILALTSKSGDLKTLTSELENAGGAAQTMADQQLDTLAGSLDSLSGSIENLWINVGQALAPTFRSVVDSLNSMIPSIQNWIVAIVQGFVGFVGQLGSTVSSITAIGGTIIDVFKNIFSAISGGGSEIGSGLADTINSVFSTIAGVVVSAAPIIENAITGIIGFFKSLAAAVSPVLSDISVIISNVINVFKAFFSGISSSAASSGAVGTISGVLTTISGALAMFSDVVLRALISIAPTIKNIFSGIVDTIQGFIPSFATVNESLGGTFERLPFVIEDTVSKLTPIGTKIKEVFSNIVDVIKNVDWQGIFNNVKSAFETGKSAIENIDWQGISNTLISAFENVKTALSGFVTELQPSWDNLKSSFESITDIIEIFRPVFESMIQSFSDNKGEAGATAFSIALTAVKISVEALIAGLNLITGVIKTVLEFFAEHPTITKFAAAVVVAVAGITALGAAVTAITAFFAPVIAGIVGIGTTLATVGAGATLAAMFPGLAGIWAAFTVGFGIVSSAVSGIISVIGMIATPFGLVIAALALFVVAWKNNWFGIRDTATAVWNGLKTSLANLHTSFQTAYTNIISQGNTLKQQFGNAWNSIVTMFSSIKTSLIASVGTLYSGLQSRYTQIVAGAQGLRTSWSTHWANFKTILSTAASNTNSLLATLYGYIQSKFNSIKSSAASILSTWRTHWNSFKSATSSAAAALNSALASMLSYVQSKFNSIKSAASSILSTWKTHWNNFVSATRSAASSITSALASMLSSVQSKFNSIKSAITSLLSDWKSKWNEIVSAAKSAGSKLVSAVSGIPGDIRALASSFSNAGTAILDGLYNSIIRGFDKVIDKAKEKLKKLKNLMPSSPAKEGPFHVLPNWDTAIYDPLNASISKVSRLSTPLSNALSDIRNPIDSSMSYGLQSVSNVTTSSTTVEGSRYSIGPISVRNDNDLKALIAAVKTSIANDRRKAGIF